MTRMTRMTRIRFYMQDYRAEKAVWQAIEAELVKTFGGWTLYYAHGAWGSMVEDSKVYEMLTPVKRSAKSLRELADKWARLAGQESILWTQESVQGEFVSMAPPRVTMHSY